MTETRVALVTGGAAGIGRAEDRARRGGHDAAAFVNGAVLDVTGGRMEYV